MIKRKLLHLCTNKQQNELSIYVNKKLSNEQSKFILFVSLIMQVELLKHYTYFILVCLFWLYIDHILCYKFLFLWM